MTRPVAFVTGAGLGAGAFDRPYDVPDIVIHAAHLVTTCPSPNGCGSPAADRIPALNNPVYQCGDGIVKLGLAVCARVIRVRGGGILQDADDLAFRQDVAVIERQQKRFADRERRGSWHVGDVGHALGLPWADFGRETPGDGEHCATVAVVW